MVTRKDSVLFLVKAVKLETRLCPWDSGLHILVNVQDVVDDQVNRILGGILDESLDASLR